jgi:hypothetical protein
MTAEERTKWVTEEVLPLLKPSAAAPRSAGRPKKEVAPSPALPECEDGETPSADDYRIPAGDIKEGVCNARRFREKDPNGVDRRWKPAVYREFQCGGAIVEDGLCKTCLGHREKFSEDPTPKADWLGRLTEEPMDWCHMLGTDWAAQKKPVWGAGSAVAAPSAATSKEDKGTKKAEKEAEKATKKAEKEAEKAAKKAEKEAEAAKKKAEKEAEAAKKKAEKEAEKAAKKAEKKEPAKKEEAVAAVPAKADTTAPAATVKGELHLISGITYMVRGRNVYQYDEVSEEVGDFLGRLSADKDSFDTEAEEE